MFSSPLLPLSLSPSSSASSCFPRSGGTNCLSMMQLMNCRYKASSVSGVVSLQQAASSQAVWSTIVHAMTNYPTDVRVQKEGCLAIRELLRATSSILTTTSTSSTTLDVLSSRLVDAILGALRIHDSQDMDEDVDDAIIENNDNNTEDSLITIFPVACDALSELLSLLTTSQQSASLYDPYPVLETVSNAMNQIQALTLSSSQSPLVLNSCCRVLSMAAATAAAGTTPAKAAAATGTTPAKAAVAITTSLQAIVTVALPSPVVPQQLQQQQQQDGDSSSFYSYSSSHSSSTTSSASKFCNLQPQETQIYALQALLSLLSLYTAAHHGGSSAAVVDLEDVLPAVCRTMSNHLYLQNDVIQALGCQILRLYVVTIKNQQQSQQQLHLNQVASTVIAAMRRIQQQHQQQYSLKLQQQHCRIILSCGADLLGALAASCRTTIYQQKGIPVILQAMMMNQQQQKQQNDRLLIHNNNNNRKYEENGEEDLSFTLYDDCDDDEEEENDDETQVVNKQEENEALELQRHCCFALWRLAIGGGGGGNDDDDDGKDDKQQQTVMIAQSGGIAAICHVMQAHVTDARLQLYGCGALWMLASVVFYPTDTVAEAEDGTSVVVSAEDNDNDNSWQQQQAIAVLKAILTAVSYHGYTSLSQNNNQTDSSSSFCKQLYYVGCAALVALVRHNSNNNNNLMATLIQSMGGIRFISHALETFPNDTDIQQAGCAALDVLLSTTTTTTSPNTIIIMASELVALNGIELLRTAMQHYQSNVEIQLSCLNALLTLFSSVSSVSLLIVDSEEEEFDYCYSPAAAKLIQTICNTMKRHLFLQEQQLPQQQQAEQPEIQYKCCAVLVAILKPPVLSNNNNNNNNHQLHLQPTAAFTLARQEEIAIFGGIDCICNAMSTYEMNANVQYMGCTLLQTLACYNEGNQERIAAAADKNNVGGIELICKAMKRLGDNEKVQASGCDALGVLICSHPENQRRMAKAGGCATICTAMKVHESNIDVQSNGCYAIGVMLASSNIVYREWIVRVGGVEAICTAMRNHLDDASLQYVACYAIHNFLAASSAKNRALLAFQGGIQLVCQALERHSCDEHIQFIGFYALWSCILAYSSSSSLSPESSQSSSSSSFSNEYDSAVANSNGDAAAAPVVSDSSCCDDDQLLVMVQCNGIESICRAMVMHQGDAKIQHRGCGALWMLANMDNDEHEENEGTNKHSIANRIIQAGGVTVILGAMKKHLKDAAVQASGHAALERLMKVRHPADDDGNNDGSSTMYDDEQQTMSPDPSQIQNIMGTFSSSRSFLPTVSECSSSRSISASSDTHPEQHQQTGSDSTLTISNKTTTTTTKKLRFQQQQQQQQQGQNVHLFAHSLRRMTKLATRPGTMQLRLFRTSTQR